MSVLETVLKYEVTKYSLKFEPKVKRQTMIQTLHTPKYQPPVVQTPSPKWSLTSGVFRYAGLGWIALYTQMLGERCYYLYMRNAHERAKMNIEGAFGKRRGLVVRRGKI